MSKVFQSQGGSPKRPLHASSPVLWFQVKIQQLNCYHPRMRIGNNFNWVCLSVCLSVSLSVCSSYNFWTIKTRNFIFGVQIHLDHIYVHFEYPVHWSKSKLDKKLTYFNLLLLYNWISRNWVKVIWRSRSILLNIKVKWKEINFLSNCKCFCNLCVVRMVCLWLKGILV